MRRSSFFPVLIVLLICVVAFGFYRGWFTMSSNPEKGSNKVDVNLTMDKDKIEQDAEIVKEKTKEFVGKVKEEVTGPSHPTTDKVKPMNP